MGEAVRVGGRFSDLRFSSRRRFLSLTPGLLLAASSMARAKFDDSSSLTEPGRLPEEHSETRLDLWPVFDSHFHIIDPRFPLTPNQGYLPEAFTCQDYLNQMSDYDLRGGAIVSASFQAFDQTYLLDALRILGAGFVGVTQLPETTSDSEVIKLGKAGVRALRFNLERGDAEDLRCLDTMARRVHELSGWHTELYVDSQEIDQSLADLLCALPSASIDHLGLSKKGLPTMLRLAQQGVRVKASGFGRVDFDVASALRDFQAANPSALLFGSDLPSTRAPRPYSRQDFQLVGETLGETAARAVFWDNAATLYRLTSAGKDELE